MKCSTPALQLINSIAQQHRLELELKRKIYGWYFMYLFAGMRSDLFFERIQPYDNSGLRLDDIRQSIRNNGQILRNIKLHVYARFARTQPRFADCTYPVPASLEIGPVDTRIINTALEFRPLQVYLRSLLKQSFPVLSVEQFSAQMDECMGSKDLSDYIGKFIHRKMAFILKSHGGDPKELFKDIVSDLQEAAIYNLLRTYPRWASIGHMLAISKQAIHGRGINYIKEQVAQSRRTLITNDNGRSEAIQISWELIRESTSAIQGSSYELCTDLDGGCNSEVDYETRLSIEQLLRDKQNLKPKQQTYLNLLMGNYHAEFSLWLGESNCEVADRLRFDRYNNKVCEYMRIPADAANTFLVSLRNRL